MKIKHLLIAILATIFSINANAQDWKSPWVDHIWTNGSEMIVSVPLNEKQVLFVANGYFDAGYGYLFQIKQKGLGQYDLDGIPETAVTSRPKNLGDIEKMILDDKYANGDDGDMWKRKMVNGFDLIISYKQDKSILSVYEETGRAMSEVAQDAMQSIIVGKYTSAKGAKFQFNADGSCIFDGKQNTYYFIDCQDESVPSYHIVVNRRIWELIPTFDGMKIYTTENNDEGTTMRKSLYTVLKASKSAPRWAFTSDRPVNDFAINCIEDKEAIRLMRNEIFARHGYVFSDPKLKAYFQSCSWYKPIGDNSKVKLSEMENINVAILKNNEQEIE